MEEVTPILQNVVATLRVGCEVDLPHVALHARNAEYYPRRFPACIMRIKEPKTTALIFRTGKLVVTGAKSEKDAKLAASKFVRIIQKLGQKVEGLLDFKVQNMVGSCGMKYPIQLEMLACGWHGRFTKYEPELFPGLIYNMKKPHVTLLIFASGKLVITGAKVREEIEAAFENIYPVLCEHRKKIRQQPVPPRTFEQQQPVPPHTFQQQQPVPPHTFQQQQPVPSQTFQQQQPVPPHTFKEQQPVPPHTFQQQQPVPPHTFQQQQPVPPHTFQQQQDTIVVQPQLHNPPVFTQQVNQQHLPYIMKTRRKAPLCCPTPQEMVAMVNRHNAMVQAKCLQVT